MHFLLTHLESSSMLTSCNQHSFVFLYKDLGLFRHTAEMQSTTGPGNLSKSIFDIVRENAEMEYTLNVLCNWEDTAKCKWELSYRNDSRNWRHSNCLKYQE